MMRLEETESILEFENNESSKLFHSLLTITTVLVFKVHTTSSGNLTSHRSYPSH